MTIAWTVFAVLLSLVLLRGLRRRFWRHRRMHGPQFFVRRLSRRLDATPEQQQELSAALNELRNAVQPLQSEWRQARADLAAVLTAEQLDDARLDAAFARQDAALQSLRAGVTAVVARLHQKFDARQRQLLATLLMRGHAHAC